MVRVVKKSNGKLAPRIINSPLSIIAGVLAAIGKPFYFVFSTLIIGLAFIFSSLGLVTRLLFKSINRLIDLVFKTVRKIRIRAQKKQKPPISKLREKSKKTSAFFKLNRLRMELVKLSLWIKLRVLISNFKSVPKRLRFQIKTWVGLGIPVLLLFITVLGFYLLILKDLPSSNELILRDPEVSTKIYDRNGTLLYKIYKEKNRTIIPLTEMPVQVRLATLAAEDAEFYNHPGFSIKGIARALTQDFSTGTLQGGSTITQQLVKNVLLTPEKTIIRKIKELILSIQVETQFTKDQILEMYLNEVSYGGTAYGIEEASESFFGKNVSTLTIAESAFLAGLPKSPTSYSPFGQNPDLAFERQKEVLKLMRINKFITPETEKAALSEKLKFAPNRTEIKAPHFVMYVRQLLVDRYGEDIVEKGGLEVTTSLDIEIQQMAESVVRTEVDKLKNLNVGNGAVLVIDPKTGEILAMVGSKNYFDTANDGQVNVLTRLRQPGSSIKIVNYANALSGNYNPASIIDDSPITYVTPGSPPYSPVNYDGQFLGKISLRNAFAGSRNIPAVKILASYGVPKMVDQAQKMGISTWNNPSDFGLSLTLGGGSVKGIDLAKVYATVANEGNRPNFMPILTVRNYKGKVLEENIPKSESVLDARVAYLLTDILKDNFARAHEFGLNSYLVVKNHPEVAVKTGTSNDLRDNWAIGYSQDFLTLAWVGNNDNSSMSRIASGVTGASPIWNKIMSALIANKPSIDWAIPSGLKRIYICQDTGNQPCESCVARQEWFLEENMPKRPCYDGTKMTTNPQPTPVSRILESGISTEARPD
jgi:penicillin-binding protein 1C